MKPLFLALFVLTATTIAAQTKTFKVSPATSLVVWYVQENKEVQTVHSGSFYFSEGTLNFDRERPVSGSLEMDLTTLTNTDLKNGQDRKALVDRLYSADFLQITDFPRGRFTFEKVLAVKPKEYLLDGMLTIKGQTRPLIIPVSILSSTRQRIELSSSAVLIEGAQFGLKTNVRPSPQGSSLTNFKLKISQLNAVPAL